MNKVNCFRLPRATQVAALFSFLVTPFLSQAELLPKAGFPLGLADLVETRTVKELRPGLTHVHVVRGAWPAEGPPKYGFTKPDDPEYDTAQFRAFMESAGYVIHEYRFDKGPGPEPEYFLYAGEFNTREEARQAARKLSRSVNIRNPTKSPGWETGPYVLDIVIVDPKVYRGKVVSAWSGKAWRESPLELARKHNAVVATNGSFFEYSIGEIAGIPTGISIVQGEWHHEPQPPDHHAPMLFLDNDPVKGTSLSIGSNADAPPFPEFKWIGKDGTPKSITLDGIDRMPKKNDLVAMRPAVVDMSPLSHHIPPNILLRQIGEDGYLAMGYFRAPSGLVLMATGDKQAILNEAMESGEPVELDLRVPSRPGLNAWYSTPALMKDGLPNEGMRHHLRPRLSRTMMGADAEGKIYLISVDGADPDLVHKGGPVGAVLNDLVKISEFLGLINAGNLDGGGRSTSMVIEGEVLSYDNDVYLTTAYDDDRRVGDAVLIIDDE